MDRTFKFQSDSINTVSYCQSPVIQSALNSNLILLIPVAGLGNWGIVDFKFQSDSINTDIIDGMTSDDMGFKFQSDSINTLLLQIS